MNDSSILDALSKVLQGDPRNGALWLHYADLLEQAGRGDEALVALRRAFELDDVRLVAARKLVASLREAGQYAEAVIRAEAALGRGEDPELRAELERVDALRARAGAPAVNASAAEPVLAAVEREDNDPNAWAAQFDWGDLRVTFADVAGLEEAKRQIRLRILAPFTNPEIYQAYRREGGGGILMYGPPGCGKTYLARATAGEIGARFVSVSIHDVLDKYYGESEKLVHSLFEHARRNRPTVLFFDEFDALGAVRRADTSSFLRSVVDQILQEMDGVGGRNRDVLLIAATNTPWNIDVAFRRPGRFDRVLFVPPPDDAARRALLTRHLERVPGGAKLELSGVVKRTAHFSGADLRELCERASEGPLERSLADGRVHEVRQQDLDRSLAATRSSIVEWFAGAKNYVRFANQGGQYDDLAAYLSASKLG
jgi:transitional endoplasmic reticulum ATPase